MFFCKHKNETHGTMPETRDNTHFNWMNISFSFSKKKWIILPRWRFSWRSLLCCLKNVNMRKIFSVMRVAYEWGKLSSIKRIQRRNKSYLSKISFRLFLIVFREFKFERNKPLGREFEFSRFTWILNGIFALFKILLRSLLYIIWNIYDLIKADLDRNIAPSTRQQQAKITRVEFFSSLESWIWFCTWNSQKNSQRRKILMKFKCSFKIASLIVEV